jgi:tetratricopeptide (TPR) repeat protein
MSVFILIFTSIFCYPVDDSYWSNRNSAEGAKEAYEYYKQQYSNEQNYENSWKFARSAHFYADDFLSDQKLKRIIFTEGKMAAERATNLAPDKAEGHYYLAICYGSWAELNGIFNGLSAADLIIKEATTVINIDPSYEDGAGYILRGRVYQEAPGIISVGDWKKAQDDYEKALKISPNNRLAYRFYAELLMATDKKKAKELIMQGLDIPLDQANSYDDESEIKNLKELLKKL